MLTSMQGMMERTRQAVSLLKERITLTQAELERREVTIVTVLIYTIERLKKEAYKDKLLCPSKFVAA